MLFCSTCFAPAQAGAKFCNFCGAKIEPKERSDPWIGKLFAGKYVLQKKLGTGSYGEVYQAESTQTQQRVAIKILRKTLLQNPQTISRFQREAVAANRLEHPAALRVYECAQLDSGELYFAMELVDGQSLKQHIEKRTLNMEEFFSVFVPLCEVLYEAHQKGIVHRDLKPDNIMLVHVEKRLLPKLLDFGLAGMLGEAKLTMTGTVIGTPAYMAPEQWGGLKFADGRSDLYGLGTIAFRCLSGRLPFEARSPAEWLKKHKFELPQDLRACARWVPPNLSAVVMRLLEKSPAQRYQSARELREALLRVQTSLEPTVIGGEDLEVTSFRADIAPKPTKEPTEESPTQQVNEALLAEESFSTVKVSQEPIEGGPSFTMLCLEENRTLLHVVARGEKIWISASRGGLYSSRDAGHSWERFLYEKGASLYSLWLGPKDEQLLCGEGGLLLLSQEQYFHALSPQTTHSLYCIWSSPRGVYIAGEQGTLLRKNGDVVFVLRVGDTTLFSGCQSAFGDLIVVGKKGTIHRSTDFGFTWGAKASSTESDLHAVTASASGELIAVGKAGTILRSTDRGHSWSQQESPFFEDLYGVGFSPNGAVFAVGGQGTILRRASPSSSWEKLASPTRQDLYSLSFLPTNRLIAVGDSGTVLLASEGD